MVAKYQARAQRKNGFVAIVLTAAEAIATLLMLRFVYRMVVKAFKRITGGKKRGVRQAIQTL